LPLAFLTAVNGIAVDRAISGHPTVAALALSPDRLAAGHVWLFATSAVIVNGSVVPQLVALAVTMVTALRILGGWFVTSVMVVAHIGATLLAYAVLFIATGDVDGAHHRGYDYGTSAIWLGLLGALAVALLRPARHADRAAQLVVATACACVTAGVLFFPLMSAVEHAFAFALGGGLAALRESRRFAGQWARSAASTASEQAAAA
jgi:hypothetical protein